MITLPSICTLRSQVIFSTIEGKVFQTANSNEKDTLTQVCTKYLRFVHRLFNDASFIETFILHEMSRENIYVP
jgi:hypothetical protein